MAVTEENSVNRYFIRKINSQVIQAVVVPKYLEYVLTNRAILLHLVAKELVGGVIPLDLVKGP